jgi:CDGSH-type Zn-finger protein
MFSYHLKKGIKIMSTPVRSADAPFKIEVEQGKAYYWCACGKSQSQPFCDGSHRDTDFTPVKFIAKESKTVYFCGCKATKNKPLCDGSHSK